MSGGDIQRMSAHEAGHALAAYRLGRRVSRVSVVPDPGRLGHTAAYPPPAPRQADMDRLAAMLEKDPALPLPCWPARVRARFEQSAVIAAAGLAGEDALFWVGADGTLMREQSPGLADTVRLVTSQPDTAEIDRTAATLYPADETTAAAWVAWVRAQATAIMADGMPQLQRLAAEVAAHGDLPGNRIRMILGQR